MTARTLTTHARWRRFAAAGVGLLLLLLLVTLAAPARVGAHAFLDRSDPVEGALLPEGPREVRLWFTEPPEPASTFAELYDAEGNRVTTDPAYIGDEPALLILPMPQGLPKGTYTVQWRNVSTVDGHPQSGYLAFTIGTQADVVTPAPPKTETFNPPPGWLDASARWLALLGVAGAVGALVSWLLVVRLARDPLPEDTYERVRERVAALVFVSLAVALVGSVVALSVQAAAGGDGYGPAAMVDVVRDTRFGHLWIVRVLLLFVLATLVTGEGVWEDPPKPSLTALTLLLCGGLLLPFALNSHSAAPGEGRYAAIAADWLHLAASSVWVGGLLALLVVLVYGTRGAPRADRRAVFAEAIPRFSTLAIASVVVLALTGFYSAWLHVGNLVGLRETSYGQTLLVKLVLLVPLLALGAYNQLVLGPRMRSAARAGRHFGRTLAAEALLGVGILFAVGLLTSLPTARETVTAEAERASFHFANDTAHAVLHISPGAAGINAYTADIGFNDQDTLTGTTVFLRFRPADGLEGEREAQLLPSFGNRFEQRGAELSVVGNWELELILRRPDQEDQRFTATLDVPKTPPSERVPGAPPRFADATAAAAMLFLALAVAAMTVSLRQPGVWQDKTVGTLIGVALAVASSLILWINRVEETPDVFATNPIPLTAESVAAGRQLFVENCATCHGDQGQGDGPTAATLERPPANLTEGHVEAHTDGDLRWWIANGIEPSMPGFGDELSDEEIWHLVNYVRSLRAPVVAGDDPPTALGTSLDACAVLPADAVQAATGESSPVASRIPR